jgi:demethylspheroidene O-methyltransferase
LAGLTGRWRPLAGLTGRWRALRDRLLGSARFRDWAARFPPTRPIARRQARELFDLTAGFVYAQVLLACVRLDLFARLAPAPRTAAELAPELGLTEERALRLLRAAAALKLAEPRGGGRFGLGWRGAVLAGDPAIVAMIAHHGLLYEDLRDPVALLRAPRVQGALAGHWPYATAGAAAALPQEQVAGYSALMAASQPLVTRAVLQAAPLAGRRCLMDVGGGDGTFLAAAGARYPQLRLTLFDLPAVADRARARFDAAGLGPRAAAIGGDFHHDALPQHADVISLVRVVHDHDDDRAAALLGRAHAALPPGGMLILAEPMAGTRGAEAMGDAYFGFYLLAMGSGRPRRPDELVAMLRAAGFARVRLRRTATPLLVQVLLAWRE